MDNNERFGAIECILFVSGDPVPIEQLKRALSLTDIEIRSSLTSMAQLYEEEKRGVQIYMTEETAQLVSNRRYSEYVLQLLQPTQSKSFSQAMLETLSIVAYKQPVTRMDIEAIRGVRCEYAVSQLLKLGMITELGRKDVVGRPMLFGTTDAFLRQFGLVTLKDLPRYADFIESAEASDAVTPPLDAVTPPLDAVTPPSDAGMLSDNAE